ncbi:MAG: hypothetical protein ACRYE7_00095 [Janthinobacterium lividum]
MLLLLSPPTLLLFVLVKKNRKNVRYSMAYLIKISSKFVQVPVPLQGNVALTDGTGACTILLENVLVPVPLQGNVALTDGIDT